MKKRRGEKGEGRKEREGRRGTSRRRKGRRGTLREKGRCLFIDDSIQSTQQIASLSLSYRHGHRHTWLYWNSELAAELTERVHTMTSINRDKIQKVSHIYAIKIG